MTTQELKFDEKGLIPAVVQDFYTKKVLTVAYMNAESLDITLREKRTCFWSRSRQELWRKGETSGNVQHVVSVTADCDGDALVVEVIKDGPACHLGTDICFSGTRRCSGFHWRRCTRCWRAAMPSVPRAAIPPTCLKKGGKKS